MPHHSASWFRARLSQSQVVILSNSYGLDKELTASSDGDDEVI